MKIENSVCKYVKNMEGFLLGIGVQNEEILKQIEKNTSIKTCILLGKGQEGTQKGSNPSVNIRDFRKKWKRKRIDYILADAREVFPYLKYFIKDSIYINKRKIIFFIPKERNQEEVLEILIKRYHRYAVETQIEKCADGLLLVINILDRKQYYLKDRFYFVLDTIEEWLDKLSEVLEC